MGYPTYEPTTNDRLYLAATRLVRISTWIDDYPPNAARDREAMMWSRVAKVGEEFGEVISEMISATGQNPRKGLPADGAGAAMERVRKELLDVALTALCAIEHLDDNEGTSVDALLAHVAFVHGRAFDENLPAGPDYVAVHGG